MAGRLETNAALGDERCETVEARGA